MLFTHIIMLYASLLPALTRCFNSFPTLAAILSSSLPHRIMVRLAHHKALRVLPHIVCGEGSDVWWFVFGWTCIASQGGCVWETTFKGKKRKRKQNTITELLVGPVQSSKAKSHLSSCRVCKKNKSVWQIWLLEALFSVAVFFQLNNFGCGCHDSERSVSANTTQLHRFQNMQCL